MCILCAIKLELTYNHPSRAFKVSEIFKDWFYQFHSPTPTSEFPWLNGNLNSGLLRLFLSSYPLYHSREKYNHHHNGSSKAKNELSLVVALW